MSNDDDCHDNLEVKSVLAVDGSKNNKVYMGEYVEKKISAAGLYSDDNIDEKCLPRVGMIFGVLDKDGNEDSDFLIEKTLADDIKKTYFPTKFTAPNKKKDEVVAGMKRGIFIRDANFEVRKGRCERVPDTEGGVCYVLGEGIVFAEREPN